MSNNQFGIYNKSYNLILEVLNNFSEINEAVIFSSRAMNNYKKGSDIDIAIVGEKINFKTVVKLYGILNEELPIPYFVDIVDFKSITEEKLKQHILIKGQTVYLKKIKT